MSLTEQDREQHSLRYIQEQYTNVEQRIRGITTALWLTKAQTVALEPMKLQEGSLRKRLQAYQDLSVLFTMDSSKYGPVIVTGGPTQGSSLSISLVTTYSRTPSSRTARGSQNSQSCSVNPRVTVQRIFPSNMSLGQLVESGSATTTPMNHFCDVLQALKLSSFSGAKDDMELVHRFILARCWPEFRARIDAAQYLLQYPPSATLISVLRDWRPVLRGSDSLYGVWVEIADPFLLGALRAVGVRIYHSTSESSGAYRCMFDESTAPGWYKLLCNILGSLFSAVFTYQVNWDRTVLVKIAYYVQVLAPLLDSVPIQTLFRTSSFRGHIGQFRKWRSHASLIHSSTINVWQTNIINDEQKVGDSFRESEGEHLTRYLHSLLAWYKASIALFQGSARLSSQPPVFQVVLVPISVQSPLVMHSPADLAWQELEAVLASKFNYTLQEMAVVQNAVYRLLGSTPVRGRSSDVRAEAFLPADIHALALTMTVLKGSPSPGSSSAPSPVLITQDYLSAEHLVAPFDRLLGFPSPHPLLPKCCYCCSLLYDILYNPNRALDHVADGSGARSNGPNAASFVHSGLLVPWTPPPMGYGLSLRVLETLERELCQLLVASLLKRLRTQN
ncbi:hypothetical protein VNI00_005286 [Paramarasmius palmivorus]|uniref:Uncharacterized protein n=1 Tax=Paramarasmius palmivorus TaxID=297713 RepID=A0AAW0DGD6_9AGAR